MPVLNAQLSQDANSPGHPAILPYRPVPGVHAPQSSPGHRAEDSPAVRRLPGNGLRHIAPPLSGTRGSAARSGRCLLPPPARYPREPNTQPPWANVEYSRSACYHSPRGRQLQEDEDCGREDTSQKRLLRQECHFWLSSTTSERTGFVSDRREHREWIQFLRS